MLLISENEVKDRLRFDNPWWEGEGIEQAYRAFPRRSYFKPFCQLVTSPEINRAVILMGPRRVGKTVMVFHTIQELLTKGISGNNILYLSLETPIFTGLSLEKIVLLFRSLFEHKKSDRLYIFFDEIQYLKDWEVHLKSLVDSYKSYRFVATGSAAAALRLKSRESGAGRFTDFMLPPLTFSEYLSFIDRKDELIKEVETESTEFVTGKYATITAKKINELNKEFINYLNYGGYPEAVFSPTIQSDSARYIKSDIIDKVLLRDLPSLYGINDIQELNRLFTTIAYNTGKEITLESLAQSSGVAKNTLKKYLEYLEAAFLIKRVHRVDQNCRHFERVTSFKTYLTNPSMRAALFGHINPESSAMGALTETAIFSQWLHSDFVDHLYYARWKDGEVDIVASDREKQKPSWAVEVKWSDRPFEDKSLLKSVISFAHRNDLDGVVVTTRTKSGNSIINGIEIEFRPSSVLTYTLGRNILETATHRGVSRSLMSRSI